MYRDEVLEEVWRNRDAYVKRHHHSLDEIVADLTRREAMHPQDVVDKVVPRNKRNDQKEQQR